MGQKSSIKKLDPRIRQAVDSAIREDRATIDQLVDMIEGMGGEASRSAVGRYKQTAERQMAKFRQAQEISKLWIGRLEDDPTSDVGRLLSEMLRTVAWQTISQFDENEEGANPNELMFTAKAIKELAQADKISADREMKIRASVVKEIAETVEETASAAGMTADTVKAIKAQILGVGK